MNSTPNLTLQTNTKRYVFQPVDFSFKIAAYSLLGVIGFYALAANGTVLYLKETQKKKRERKGNTMSFSRFHVITSYVQSLAMSDFLCGAIAIPLAIVTNFVDSAIDTDYKCKAVRYVNLFLAIVTINNLLVIAVERHIAVFHPLNVPSLRTIWYTIIASWILGALVAILPSSTFELKRIDIDKETYTIVCRYNDSVPAKKHVFLVFTVCY